MIATTMYDLRSVSANSSGSSRSFRRCARIHSRDTQYSSSGQTGQSASGRRYSSTTVSLLMYSAKTRTPSSITAFTVTGGGAKFNLGPQVDLINQVTLGIGNVAARNLGDSTNGFLDELASGQTSNVVDGDLETGQKLVDNAIDQISKLRGRLGAFQKNVVGATIRSLGVALENTSAAESVIRDTDFASETASLTRNQILVNAATNVLSIANSQPQSVLSLLG